MTEVIGDTADEPHRHNRVLEIMPRRTNSLVQKSHPFWKSALPSKPEIPANQRPKKFGKPAFPASSHRHLPIKFVLARGSAVLTWNLARSKELLCDRRNSGHNYRCTSSLRNALQFLVDKRLDSQLREFVDVEFEMQQPFVQHASCAPNRTMLGLTENTTM